MKSASLLVILFFSITLVTFASIMVEAVAAENPVIVGKWDRTDGVDVYTIYANRARATLKEMIRALGMNPEQMLTRDALSQGATTYKNDEELQNSQLQMLSQQLRQLIHQEAPA